MTPSCVSTAGAVTSGKIHHQSAHSESELCLVCVVHSISLYTAPELLPTKATTHVFMVSHRLHISFLLSLLPSCVLISVIFYVHQVWLACITTSYSVLVRRHFPPAAFHALALLVLRLRAKHISRTGQAQY